MDNLNQDFSASLRKIAKNKVVKSFFETTPAFYSLLLPAAKRYIFEKRKLALERARGLQKDGYNISLEVLAESIDTLAKCTEIKKEFLTLIEKTRIDIKSPTICLDLSGIGLCISKKVAFENLEEITNYANKHKAYIMISMESSKQKKEIIDIYSKVASRYTNIGITLQVYSNTYLDDIKLLTKFPGKIRVVKGAYDEDPTVSIKRSIKLNERYVEILDILHHKNHPTAVATHDNRLLKVIEERNFLNRSNIEVEMLYGVSPENLRTIKDKGVPSKVYITYGKKWLLHLLHRLAEHPPSFLQALVDCENPSEISHCY